MVNLSSLIIGSITLLAACCILILNRRLSLNNRQLEEQMQYYQSLYSHNPNAVIIFNVNRTIREVNPQTVEQFGYLETEMRGQSFAPIVLPEYKAHTIEQFEKACAGQSVQFESAIRDADGVCRNLWITNLPIFVGHTVKGVYAIIQDMTEKKKAEHLIRQLAYYDTLTGLPNRSSLMEKLRERHKAISGKDKQASDSSYAILYIDIHQFKQMNEMMGHAHGDELMKLIAERIHRFVKQKGQLYRLEGDEFIALVNQVNDRQAMELGQEMTRHFTQPFYVSHYELHVRLSIGISVYPQHADDPDGLIHAAQAAMIAAKQHGSTRVNLYALKEYERLQERNELQAELYHALQSEELVLLYQPMVDLQRGKIVGVETLVRWQHPTRGLLTPQHFIPLAEENGYIIPLGQYVLEKACHQMRRWKDEGLDLQFVSVNISARQVHQSDICQTVRQALDEAKLSAHCLELELTESVTMDIQRTELVLSELKKLGVQISIDDFGTGYSSLAYLKRMPLDKLKIDRSFIEDCVYDLHDAHIVRAITAMSRSLNLRVTAEGVEKREQLTFLQNELCDEAQGYLFSPPISAEEFSRKVEHIERQIAEMGLRKAFTEQVKMNESIRMLEQDLRDILRLQQGMMMKVQRVDGRFVHTFCEGELIYRMGLIPDQLIGKTVWDIGMSEETARFTEEHYAAAWDGKHHVTYEGQIGRIGYLATLRPVYRGGKVVEIVGILIDITERREMEAELKRSEMKYRFIAENTMDLLISLNRNEQIVYVSPSCIEMLGYLPYDLEHRRVHEVQLIDGWNGFESEFAAFADQQSSLVKQWDLLHRNGSRICTEATCSPIWGKDGQLEQVIIAARDMTEQRKTETLIRQSDRLNVVGELAAGVAHEIRNPLTAIKGFVKLLQQNQRKDHYYEIMLEELERIEMIVTELLMLSKPQAVTYSDVQLNELLHDLITLLDTQAIMNNIGFKLITDQDIPVMKSNVHQLKQVLINLIKNAMESMNHGGIIELSTAYADHWVYIRIVDEGSGISEERMKNLGEPFYSTKEKGVGLGLTVSNKIVKELGGTIRITSKVGEGTDVVVALPLQKE
ncbi:EAL domain-containing protein [Marinicrinis sediminis]|uniref:histidine kinase n=1 Tax=Marinicrinis sediminis TaxID=1652465 RepID=A0ABW5RF81_9BACL